MNVLLKTQIADIRKALFEGRFADASKTVETMRHQDPQLNELARSFEHNHFGLFSFQSFSTDRKYLSSERLTRQKLVLSWMSLPDQLDLFGLAIGPEDLSVELVECIKFNQRPQTTKNRNDLIHLIGYWLAHQKIQEAKYVMEQTGISLHEKVNNIFLAYKNKNVRGGFSIQNIENVPLYTVLAFNYTPALFEFVHAEGVSLSQVASTFMYVDASENEYFPEILQNYKTTQFVALKSYIEHFNITQALENDEIHSPTVRKKM